ncbi:MAG: ATP-binding domain-containing protein, partial [Burkholderiales bacterium]
GDKDQLASVEAGAVLGDLCQGADAGGYSVASAAALQALTGQALPAAMVAPQAAQVENAVRQQTVMLRRSRRFGGPIGALAAAVNAGDAAEVRRCLQADDPAVGSTVCVLAPEGQLSLMDSPPDEAAAAGLPAPGLQQRLLARVLDGVALPARADAPAAIVGSLRAVYQQVRRGPSGPDEAAHATWVQAVLAGFDGCRVLAALRAGPWGVAGLNQALEGALAQAGLIHPGSARNGWYTGRPVLVTRNDPAAGVFNGDVGLALPGPQGGPLRVWFADGPQLRSVGGAGPPQADEPPSGGDAAGVWGRSVGGAGPPQADDSPSGGDAAGVGGRSVLASRLAQVDTAFAMTVHKSQGSEFAHTVLVLPPRVNPVLSRELLYTGITRARQALTLVLPGPGVLEAALARRTRRAGGLADGLAEAD